MSEGVEVVVFPRIAGVQWSDTVGSTLWGMASQSSWISSLVLRRLRRSSCQPLQVAWSPLIRCTVLQIWRSVGPAGQGPVCSSGSGGGSRARGGPGPPGRSAGVHTGGSGGHVEIPDPSGGGGPGP